MNAKDLRKKLRSEFPSLSKPFLSENIFCFDEEYYVPTYEEMEKLNNVVWQEVEHLGLYYIDSVSDCDDFSAVMLGRIKEAIMELAMVNETKKPWTFGELSGKRHGEQHSFNGFLCDRGIFISDYGDIKNTNGYKPVWARF